MGANSNAMLLGEAHRGLHDARIGGMIAAGDIGLADIGHDRCIVAAGVDAIGLAHIAIDVDVHAALQAFRHFGRLVGTTVYGCARAVPSEQGRECDG